MTDIHALVEKAYDAGIEFHFYAGGSLIFGTPNRLAQHADLAAELRASRDDVARYLRAMGPGSTTDKTWIEHYRVYGEPAPSRNSEEDY